MTLGSLFDGIGGWLLAARHASITPIWASEIEPFPSSVTARHFPDVKQLGDITQIDPNAIEPVDIICAGSPCQDLSIAGKRKGLDSERSGLFRTAVELVRGMRIRTGGGILGSLSGRTSQVLFHPTGGWIFKPCSKKSEKVKFQCLKVIDGLPLDWCNARGLKSHGGYWTHNIGEYPNEESESSLSRILQPMEDVPEKYYLSQRGGAGILRRAKERGKVLPKELRVALESLCMTSNTETM